MNSVKDIQIEYWPHNDSNLQSENSMWRAYKEHYTAHNGLEATLQSERSLWKAYK